MLSQQNFSSGARWLGFSQIPLIQPVYIRSDAGDLAPVHPHRIVIQVIGGDKQDIRGRIFRRND